MSLVVSKVAETNTTITLGWTPVPCVGYVLYVDGVRKSNSWDSDKSTWKVSKGASEYRVVALGIAEEGRYSPAVPPPTTETPYTASSPWNTRASWEKKHQNSDAYIARLAGYGGLTNNADQYTFPVYTGGTVQTMRGSGLFSDVRSETTLIRDANGFEVSIKIPDNAEPSVGSDGQIIILDGAEEWGFWRASRDSQGNWNCTNGYRYNTTWSGVPPDGFGSRGAGVPYLAGLVRPHEMESGRIPHALALGTPSPSPEFVYPATKSDGQGQVGVDVPEGARVMLDPAYDTSSLTTPGRILAKALQEYGAYVIDHAGANKLYLEDRKTAGWGSEITTRLVNSIPWSRMRVVT